MLLTGLRYFELKSQDERALSSFYSKYMIELSMYKVYEHNLIFSLA